MAEARTAMATMVLDDHHDSTGGDEAPVAPSYVRLHSTAEMSVSEQPLLKRSGTSDTLEESSTEVN